MARKTSLDEDTAAAKDLATAFGARQVGPRWYECRAVAEALFRHVNAGARAGLNPLDVITETLLRVRDTERAAVEAAVRSEAAAALEGGIDAARREMSKVLDGAAARARRIMGVE